MAAVERYIKRIYDIKVVSQKYKCQKNKSETRNQKISCADHLILTLTTG